MTDEKPKKRRYGPMPRPQEALREHRLSVYFTDAEWKRLTKVAGDMQPAAYLRSLAFDGGPVVVPKINYEQWTMLGRAAGNLNQIAKRMNSGEQVDARELRDMLARLRRALIGAREFYESENHEG